MSDLEHLSGAETPGTESRGHKWTRRKLIALGTTMLLIGGALGVTSTILIERAKRASNQHGLSMDDIRTAAKNLGHQCIDLTANGTTTQSGTNKDRTITRSFVGGTTCRVVVQNGEISDVNIREPSPPSRNSGPTTYDLRYLDKARTTQGGATSWQFYEGAMPDVGNVAGVAIKGVAFSDGDSQSWVIGVQKDQLTPTGASDSSIEYNAPGFHGSSSQELFDHVDAGMLAALNTVAFE